MIPLRTARQEPVWRRLASLDQALLLVVRRWETPWTTRLMRTFTHLGDPASWVVIGLALGLGGGREGPRHAALLGTAAALAVVVSQLLKRLCCRTRPVDGLGGFAPLVECPDVFSFPSGHTTVAFAVVVALAGQGSGLGLAALVLAVGIAVSRVYLGAHYPVDVAAGVLVGALAGVAARLLVAGSDLLALAGYAGLSAVGLAP